MSKPQVIVAQSGERLVVLPESQYLNMVERLEDVEDLSAVRAFDERLAAGREEFVPAEIVDRLLSGESKIKVWREYRGETVAGLAGKAGLSAAYVSQIEAGRRRGGVETLRRLAEALRLDLDDLV